MEGNQKQAERGQGTVVGRRWYVYRVGGLYCTLDADTRQDAEEYISESQGCDSQYISEHATRADADAALLRLAVGGGGNA